MNFSKVKMTQSDAEIDFLFVFVLYLSNSSQEMYVN